MKTHKLFIAAIAMAVLFAACDNGDAETDLETTGSVMVEFDNMVGTSLANLETEGSTNYSYTTTSSQSFNLTRVQYYISKITLTGPEASFEDQLNVSANADEVAGYYFIQESDNASKLITLENVPEGVYTQITFTVGIDESGVQEGAAGGILDPANGAPFWNWNAGYIGMTIEGHTDVIDDNAFAIHVGGWKDIVPEDGTDQKFYNNVKTITLNLDVNMNVSETLEPEVHIVTDIKKVLGEVDFTATPQVHSPAAGRPFADNLTTAFVVDHVHQ